MSTWQRSWRRSLTVAVLCGLRPAQNRARKQAVSSAKRRRPRGLAVVELALGLMIFVMMLVGLLELGRGVWTFTTIEHAARQGARFAAVRGQLNPTTNDAVRNAVRTAAVGLKANDVSVTTTWPNGVDRGNPVVVQVSYPFRLVTGNLIVGQSTIQIRANSRMILAN